LWGSFLSYQTYQDRKKQKSAWPDFAKAQDFSFMPGKFADHSGCISGEYSGHRVKIETTANQRTRFTLDMGSQTMKRVLGSALASSIWQPEKVVNILKITRVPDRYGGGRARIENDGDRISYVAEGVINDPEQLESILTHLKELASAYLPLIAVGGEIIPALRNVTSYSDLERPAIALMRGIGKSTTNRFAHQAGKLQCRRCLTSFAPN